MIHPFTLITGRFCPMVLGLFICLGSLQPARAQMKSKQEIDLLLDSMSKELYQFNYFDSLNNEPHFFTFPQNIRKISLMAASLGYDEGYYRSEEVRAKYYSYNDVVYRVYEVYDSAATRAGKLGDVATQARFTYLKGAEYRRNDFYDIALEYYTLGRQGHGDSALYYGQRVYDLSLQREFPTGVRKGLNALIMGHQLEGNHQMVLKLTAEMEEHIEPSGEVGYLVTPLLNRSKSYAAMGHLTPALQDVNESLRLAKKVGFQNGRLNAMKWKMELMQSKSAYDSALVLSSRLLFLKDSLYQVETEERLASVYQNFEIRERENRIAGLEQINRANERRLLFRNLAILALVLVFVVLMLLLYLVNKRRLDKQQYALREAKDQLLRSQLNPHFLFNALSSIQLFLINKGQGKEALEYLSKFAKLMRRILENSRESLVSLEDEMATLRHYLDLQKIRFDNKFEYQISVETENDPADLMIPPMFAQPFIENSLEHGISHRDDGMIQIWFHETAAGLNFRVEDNGIGISRSMKTNKEESHRSLATIITRDRINIMKSKLKKRIRFDIRDKMNEREEVTGTEVVFELPVIYR